MSTGAAAMILTVAGLATAGKEVVGDHNTHDRIARFSPVPPFANNEVDASETQYIESDFKNFLNTWTGYYPGMRNVSLDLALSGKATCKSSVIESNSINGMDFCAPENEIIITRGSINLINELSLPYANTWRAANETPADFRPQVEHQLIDLVLAHELGHAAQLAMNGKVKSEDLPTELQADCYAGRVYRDTGLTADYQEALNLYGLISPNLDFAYGTPAQRSASFEEGLATGSCA